VAGSELRSFLQEMLPPHLVPTSWVALERLPLTPTEIGIIAPKTVTVVAGGKSETVSTTVPTVADLLADETPVARPVLRAHERPVFSSDGGLQKLLLSRPPLRQLEVYEGTFDVGGSTGPEAYAHDNAQELFYVLTGHIELSIASETLILGPRDSVEYLSSVPHRAVNIGATTAQVMWITSHFTPPIDTNPLNAPPAHQTKD